MSENEKSNNGIISKALDWAYSKALTGYIGVDSAYQLGDSFLKQKGSLDKQVDKLIKWQVSKAATSGFLTGIGGFTILPFALPANVASVIYIQIRMISAIAYMGGHDIQSEQVKTMVMAAMLGNGAKEILKDMGIKAGEKLMMNVAREATAKSLASVNEKVGTSMVSKLGYKGLSKLGKAVPLMGGLVGGFLDGTSTKITGKIAKKIFIENNNSETIIIIEEEVIPANG